MAGDDLMKVILKVEPHCYGCVSTIADLLRGFKGVECVKTEWDSNKFIVIGSVDPVDIRDTLADKTNKKVQLVSPTPPPPQKPKEPPVTTAVLKLSLHCQGCTDKINKILRKTDGIYYKDIDRDKGLVTVKGSMDAKALVKALNKTLHRPVEILPPKESATTSTVDACPQCQSANPQMLSDECLCYYVMCLVCGTTFTKKKQM